MRGPGERDDDAAPDGDAAQDDGGSLGVDLAGWLAPHRPGLTGLRVSAVSRPTDGYVNETIVFTLDGTSCSGSVSERLVLRLAPEEAPLPDYELVHQARLHPRLAAAGIPVPSPVILVEGEGVPGGVGMVMPFVDGHIVGDAPAVDPWMVESTPEGRRQVHGSFVEMLARIHRLGAETADCGFRAFRTLADEVAWWQGVREAADAGRPVVSLAEALQWCLTNAPRPSTAPTVLWGDVRLGNVIFGDRGEVASVLDWDMAGQGPAELDLGYYLALDRAAGTWGSRGLDGFLDHDQVVARWEDGVGRSADALEWYEIFGLCRSLVVSNQVCRLARRAGHRFPLVDDETNPVLQHLVRRIGSASRRSGRDRGSG